MPGTHTAHHPDDPHQDARARRAVEQPARRWPPEFFRAWHPVSARHAAAPPDNLGPDVAGGGLVGPLVCSLVVSVLGMAAFGALGTVDTSGADRPGQVAVAGAGAAVPAGREATGDGGSGGTGEADPQPSESPEPGTLDARAGAGQADRSDARGQLDTALADAENAERTRALASTGASAQQAALEAASVRHADAAKDRADAIEDAQARAEEKKKEAARAAKAAQEAQDAPGDQKTAERGTLVRVAVSAGTKATTPIERGSYRVGARFGAVGSWSRYHTGQDLSAPMGTPVRAAMAGTVAAPAAGSWAGTHVVIDHGEAGTTLYAHLSGSTVSTGQQVEAGQLIGYVGQTGRAFGPHLHFEHYAGHDVSTPYVADDPSAWLSAHGAGL